MKHWVVSAVGVLSLAILVLGISSTSMSGPGPGVDEKKAREYAADCVYAAMNAGYTGTSADIGQFCVEAISVVMNANY